MSHLEEGRLHELLDGELDESARAAALAHLAGCERCRAAYEEAKSFVAESDALIDAVQLPAQPAARAAAPAVAPTVAHRAVEVRDVAAATRLRRYRTLAWAASVMFAVGLGWYGSSLSRRHDAPTAAETVLTALDSGAKAPQEPAAEPAAKPTGAPKDER
ncbi:MAG TPA: zf-HC2 domain-containing protein, partial [Gemmatimonadales bacterium]|nr:zf-HC2 domain-containing protein [Gemmatimonadales bacterium]